MTISEAQARRIEAIVDPGGLDSRAPGNRRVYGPWLTHLPFAVLLVVASIPRVIALWGYRPVLMFFGDSQAYLIAGQNGEPTTARPFGYSSFLRLISWTDHIWLVPVVQHLAILGLAIALYVTLLRLKAPVWLAFIVPAPMLLDGYQILIEHVALTETLFICLVMAALLLLIRRRVTMLSAATVGLLMAYASLTRSVAVPVVMVAIAYLVVRRVGWRPIAVCVVAFSIPLFAYAAWFSTVYGTFALQQDGRFLYARVAPIADCSKLSLSKEALVLCDDTPIDQRQGSNYYAWNRKSPFNAVTTPEARAASEIAGREFGLAVIKGQPLDYAGLVARDFIHYFQPGRTASYQDTPPSWWNFPLTPARSDQQIVLSGTGFADDKTEVSLEPGAATFLRGWQSILGTQGLLLLICVILGVSGALVGRRRVGGARRLDPLLFVGVGTVLLLVPSATSVFDYRYALPAAVPLYAGAGWGILLLLQKRGWGSAAAEQVQAAGSEADLTTIARHRSRPRVTPWVASGVVAIVVLGIVLAPVTRQPIYQRYVRAAAERGALGYSLDTQQPLTGYPGWTLRNFVGGAIYASPNNTFVITSATLTAYRQAGGEAVLGLPVTGTSPLRRAGGESSTWFEKGAIVVSGVRGVQAVLPPFLKQWCEPGGLCALGAPLGDVQVNTDGTRTQTFFGGTLTESVDGVVEKTLNPPTPSPSATPDAPTDAVQPPDVRGD